MSFLAVLAWVLIPSTPGYAQDQPSLGDVARQARKDKEKNAAQPKRVITDDNLPSSKPLGGLGDLGSSKNAGDGIAMARGSEALDRAETAYGGRAVSAIFAGWPEKIEFRRSSRTRIAEKTSGDRPGCGPHRKCLSIGCHGGLGPGQTGKALVRRIIPNTGCKVLLGLPFRVEFRNRRADRESPSKDRKVLKFIGHCVAVLRFFSRNARLVHFLCLPGNVIKHFAERSDAFLAANLAVARNKKRVLIKCGEFL